MDLLMSGSGGGLGLGIGKSPTQEYFLQTSIQDSFKHLLLVKLRGICPDWGPFRDHEIVFNNPHHAGLSCRIRRSLLHPEFPPVLRYLGTVEIDKPVMRRTSLDIPVMGPIYQFLTELGFVPEFEYVLDGEMFIRGRTKVLVHTVNEVVRPSASFMTSGQDFQLPTEWKRIIERSHFVEATAFGTQTDESLLTEVLDIAEQLRPVINLTKHDYSRLAMPSK